MITEYAKSLGFAAVGISAAAVEENLSFYDWWLAQGYAADMQYLEKQRERRKSLANLLPGVKSVVVCLLPFPGKDSAQNVEKTKEQKYGKVARYAVAEDYHFVLKEKLEALKDYIHNLFPQENTKSLSYVDTGAFSERNLAAQAGLGWIGKNAMLIHPQYGSWFWLGEILTTATLEINQKALTDHCGTCNKCIEACPTDAIIKDKRAIDSQKCIAYWNIEHRGAIPEIFQHAIKDWLLGCDICQEVCPWNKHSLKHGRKILGEPMQTCLSLKDVKEMNTDTYKKLYKNTALSRPKLEGLQRNAAIVEKNLSLL